MTSPQQRIWPVFVINMANNTARLEKSGAALAAQSIAFERFEAVNGRNLGDAAMKQAYDPVANAQKFRHPLLRGEIGCYLSHAAVWRKIIDGKETGAIILEDDFAASGDLADVLAAISADTGPWDMIKLFSRRPDSKILQTRPLCEGRKLVLPYQIPNTTLGYAIRREAARRLLQSYLPIARPIDEDHKRFWEHGLSVWMVQPPPLSPGLEASTGDTLQSMRHSKTHATIRGVLKQGWSNLKYRLAYLARLHASRLFGRGRW